MGRIDFYRDPDAPRANSLVVAASAVVTDRLGRVLVHRRRDNGLWALPGGGMKLGESVAGCVVREVREETGYEVEPLYVIGVYSDPDHVFGYSDGEVRQEFSVCMACVLVGGNLSVSDESIDVDWIAPDVVRTVEMHPRILVRITDYLNGERGLVALHRHEMADIDAMLMSAGHSVGDATTYLVGCFGDRFRYRVSGSVTVSNIGETFLERYRFSK